MSQIHRSITIFAAVLALSAQAFSDELDCVQPEGGGEGLVCASLPPETAPAPVSQGARAPSLLSARDLQGRAFVSNQLLRAEAASPVGPRALGDAAMTQGLKAQAAVRWIQDDLHSLAPNLTELNTKISTAQRK